MAQVVADTKDTDEQQKKAVRALEERFADFKQKRQSYEQHWREIAEYCLPRRDFRVRYGYDDNAINRNRNLIDTTAATANQRLAALLFGYMMPPYAAWVRPSVYGRDPNYREAVYFEDVQRKMFGRLQAPRTGFTSGSYESLQDDVAFGNSVMWGGRNTYYGKPVWLGLPLMEHYWCENADGVVDTVFREWQIPLRAAANRYPSKKLKEKLEKDEGGKEMIRFLRLVEPREGGMMGAATTNKPIKSIVACITTGEIVEVGGYDTHPYAITRFSKRAGQDYGEGPASDALPLARVLNRMGETILRAGELQVDPPLVNTLGHLPRLDRRAGGLTNLDQAQMRRLDDPKAILRRLYEGGDPSISIELVRDIREKIQFIYFIDWMSLSINSSMTATEVNDRRDIRLRSMTPIVARGEAEKLTAVAERTYFMMQDELPRPPDSLHGEELTFEFFSPLAQAQQQSALETTQRVFSIVESLTNLGSKSGDIVDMDGTTRDALKAAGLPHKNIREQSAVDRDRAAQAQREQQEQQLDDAAIAAGAARDAGQAQASVENAGV